jgi:holo-[acyl-carrier protein] synthase
VIVGIGVDVVDVSRFEASIKRTPNLLERLLTPEEQTVGRPERLAARFAAKEALAKALGVPPGLRWHDCEVQTEPSGAPVFAWGGTVAAAAAALGATRCHLSLTHDGGVAVAYVVLEG